MIVVVRKEVGVLAGNGAVGLGHVGGGGVEGGRGGGGGGGGGARISRRGLLGRRSRGWA